MNENKVNEMISSLSEEDIEKELASIEEYNNNISRYIGYNGEDKVYKYEELKEIYAKRPKKPSLKSGYLTRLDDTVDGFRAGEVIVISGKTGDGKTTLAQSLIHDFSESGNRSLLISYEVGTEDLFDRFKVSKINLSLVDKNKAYDLDWLESKIWEAIGKHDIRAVFIDHLHYLVDFSALNGNSSLVIGQVCRRLKSMAIRTKMPIFLIAHLKQLKTEAEPTIDDIRDSSFIGQEADMVLIVWRKEGNVSIVSVVKNRRRGTKLGFPVVLTDGRFKQC